MTTAKSTVSPKYQIVIPKAIRQAIPLRRGQKVHLIAKGGIITIVPDRPLSSLRGFVKGMDTESYRDETDRL